MCSDVSVLRRLSFAAATLPGDTPNYWELVSSFVFSSCLPPSTDKVQILIKNLKYLDEKSFDTDSQFLRELTLQEGFQGRPLGIVLISANSKCGLCGGNLLV